MPLRLAGLTRRRGANLRGHVLRISRCLRAREAYRPSRCTPHAPREGFPHAEREEYERCTPHAPREGFPHAEREEYELSHPALVLAAGFAATFQAIAPR